MYRGRKSPSTAPVLMQVSGAAKGEYKTRRQAEETERDAVLGLWDLDLFNVPTRGRETSFVTMCVLAELCWMKRVPTCSGNG